MKKLFIFVAAFSLISFSVRDPEISKKEKKFASKFLKQTRDAVGDAVKGLSDAQLKFKPAEDSWGVEECVKHIAITEQMLWGMLEENLKNPPTPEKRSEVKMSDEEVINLVESRAKKVKTFDPAKPENTPYKNLDEALSSFRQNREKLIDFIKSTDADLRNHVIPLPFGSVDGYQFVLFISGHTDRHTQQINEVKANPGFPK